MHQELIELLEQGKYDEVIERIQKIDASLYNEQLMVIAATTFLNMGDLDQAFDMVSYGLALNPENYELYLVLGQIYEGGYGNLNQAYLCYENAAFYCNVDEDLSVITEFKNRLAEFPEVNVRDLSIVILSYNNQKVTQNCIESIREYTSKDWCEIIVVDNASLDDSAKWLSQQKDIIVQLNAENVGFPKGSNQGAKIANKENDVLFLNNDVIVYANSIFWLRMGLYSNDKVGSSGCMTNFAGNNQMITCDCETDEEYEQFARKVNLPLRDSWEEKIYLVGFALLIKRICLDDVGLFDERFSPGMYEDNDIGLRMVQAGWKNILCHNCFIRHYGHGNGVNKNFWSSGERVNMGKFEQKWGFQSRYYAYPRNPLIDCIEKSPLEEISVLEIGCGLGATLLRIKYLYPNAEVKGIELVEKVADIGANLLDIRQGNIESSPFPFEDMQFDYIIFGDVLEHLYDPESTLIHMSKYLKEDGCFICSIPNIMHVSVIYSLLRGEFEYQNEGILDRTHIKFFTLQSIYRMFERIGFKIENLMCSSDGTERLPQAKEFLNFLQSAGDLANIDQFTAYQYMFRARRI